MDGTFEDIARQDAEHQRLTGANPFPGGCHVQALGPPNPGLGIGVVLRNVGAGSYLVAFASGERKVVEGSRLQRAVIPKRPTPKPPKPPLRFLTYQEMVDLPEPQWLIEGLLMEQSSALLFGRSNSFKSFLAIDIACTVACSDAGTRDSWHGQRVADGWSALYIATEGALGVAKQRIPGWMDAHGIPRNERNCISLYPEEIALDDDKAVDDLIKSCAIHRAELTDDDEWDNPVRAFNLVVIDIFGSTMSGPETSDETARAWVRNMNRIKRAMRCTLLTVAHTGWADETRARMHTHFWGSFDTRLKAEGDKEARTTLLAVDRHKDADSSGRWGFRMEEVPVPDSDATTLVPRLSDEVEVRRKPRLTGTEKIAVQALSEALIEQGRVIAGPNYPSCPVVTLEQWRAMCDRHGLTSSDDIQTKGRTFRRVRDDLHRKGEIRIFDDHVWKAEA